MLDPSARLVSCGEIGWTDWDAKVIDGLVSLVDLHSVHLYTGSEDYWTNVLQPHASQRAISTSVALLRRAAYEQHLEQVPRIAYDEWNVWFRTNGGPWPRSTTFPMRSLSGCTSISSSATANGWRWRTSPKW